MDSLTLSGKTRPVESFAGKAPPFSCRRPGRQRLPPPYLFGDILAWTNERPACRPDRKTKIAPANKGSLGTLLYAAVFMHGHHPPAASQLGGYAHSAQWSFGPPLFLGRASGQILVPHTQPATVVHQALALRPWSLQPFQRRIPQVQARQACEERQGIILLSALAGRNHRCCTPYEPLY